MENYIIKRILLYNAVRAWFKESLSAISAFAIAYVVDVYLE